METKLKKKIESSLCRTQFKKQERKKSPVIFVYLFSQYLGTSASTSITLKLNQVQANVLKVIRNAPSTLLHYLHSTFCNYMSMLLV